MRGLYGPSHMTQSDGLYLQMEVTHRGSPELRCCHNAEASSFEGTVGFEEPDAPDGSH